MQLNSALCCKRCGSALFIERDKCSCRDCLQAYLIKSGIVLIENTRSKDDLRISQEVLDIHKLRNERKYFNSTIKSDVEYVARLHSINFVNFHAKLLLPYASGPIVIADLGCGQLPYINEFSCFDIKAYYGVDADGGSLKIARDNAQKDIPLILIQHGIENVPFFDSSTDVVISSEVLEHLDDPKQYLSEIKRILKKGGVLSLSTPCPSMYFYPFNLLSCFMSPKKLFLWHKQINPHKHWKEALSWHPALPPRVLAQWLTDLGFSIKKHETKMWFYATPTRLMWRLFSLLERSGIQQSGQLFEGYLKCMDQLLSLNLPIIKWAGIRQFILCQKMQ